MDELKEELIRGQQRFVEAEEKRRRKLGARRGRGGGGEPHRGKELLKALKSETEHARRAAPHGVRRRRGVGRREPLPDPGGSGARQPERRGRRMLRQVRAGREGQGLRHPDADEALLDRAYVYAMKAHGAQRRASGDPYFSHPLEVAAILTDLNLDDSTIARPCCTTPSRTRRPRARRSIISSEGDRLAGGGPHQAEAARPRLETRRASREHAQAPPRHRRRCAGPAGQARRSPPQHAHLAFRPARQARAHRPGDARHLRAARGTHGHAGHARRVGGACLRRSCPRRTTPSSNG